MGLKQVDSSAIFHHTIDTINYWLPILADMEDIWSSFLESIFPLSQISQCLIYTDAGRYWFAEGLLTVAENMGWKSQMTFLDELDEESLIEIKQSFAILPSDTLLLGMFSEYNPNLNEINLLFNPFTSPENFQGYSLLVQPSFPAQYLPDFLDMDIDHVNHRHDTINEILDSGLVVIDSSDYQLHIELASDAINYPFQSTLDNRHVLFPSTELLVQVESITGDISLNRTIGSFSENQELVDPMGRIKEPVTLEFSSLTEIESTGGGLLGRRLSKYLSRYKPSFNVLSFGLGPYLPATGFIEVDRLSEGCLTLSDPVNDFELCTNYDNIGDPTSSYD